MGKRCGGKGMGGGGWGKEGGGMGFLGRLNADWNGLVWSGTFPVLLEKLLFDRPVFADAATGEKDRRVLDPQQIAPLRGDRADRNIAGLRAMVRGRGGEGKGAPAAEG